MAEARAPAHDERQSVRAAPSACTWVAWQQIKPKSSEKAPAMARPVDAKTDT